MQKLVDLVVEKTGISQDQAQTAVETVVDFIRGKLPPAISSKLDVLLAENVGSLEQEANDAAKSRLGGFLGGGSKSEDV